MAQQTTNEERKSRSSTLKRSRPNQEIGLLYAPIRGSTSFSSLTDQHFGERESLRLISLAEKDPKFRNAVKVVFGIPGLENSEVNHLCISIRRSSGVMNSGHANPINGKNYTPYSPHMFNKLQILTINKDTWVDIGKIQKHITTVTPASVVVAFGIQEECVKPPFNPSLGYKILSKEGSCTCESKYAYLMCVKKQFTDENPQSCLIAIIYRAIQRSLKLNICLRDEILCDKCATCRHGKRLASCNSFHGFILSSLNEMPCQNQSTSHCMCYLMEDEMIKPLRSRISTFPKLKSKSKRGKTGKSEKENQKFIRFLFHYKIHETLTKRYFHLTMLFTAYYSKYITWSINAVQQLTHLFSAPILARANNFQNPKDFGRYLNAVLSEAAEIQGYMRSISKELNNVEERLRDDKTVEIFDIPLEIYLSFLKEYKTMKTVYSMPEEFFHPEAVSPHLAQACVVPLVVSKNYLYRLLEFCSLESPGTKTLANRWDLQIYSKGMRSEKTPENYSNEMKAVYLLIKSNIKFCNERIADGVHLRDATTYFTPRLDILDSTMVEIREYMENSENSQEHLPKFETHRIFTTMSCSCDEGAK